MIRTEVQQHDNFSIEFKTGFLTDKKYRDLNEFKINMYLFVPNSLDINKSTYSKDQFYKDVKRNIRLITPVYSLKEILAEGRGPLTRLEKALTTLTADPTNEIKVENYIYQIKMLMSIIKSALTRESEDIVRNCNNEAKALLMIKQLNANLQKIIKQYREKKTVLNGKGITETQQNYFSFGDNFLGNIAEQQIFYILNRLKKKEIYKEAKEIFTPLLVSELAYKKENKYLVLQKDDDNLNSLVISQRNLLKKFMESDLFLHIVKKKDGAIAEQVYYSFAAGLAMIVATLISYFANLHYGNYTAALFVLLIVSYMLKDRVKDLARIYFLSGMSKKYFDTKLKLSIRNQEIGWFKESFDFIAENKVSDPIKALHNRTPLLEAENKIYNEQIILYRKWVTLSNEDIEKYKEYNLSGINDITRISLMNFVQKMDNPSMPLYMLDDKNEINTLDGIRMYSVFFVIEYQSDNEHYYKSYRVLFNRNGISAIEEIS